jgi:hypothetical protein
MDASEDKAALPQAEGAWFDHRLLAAKIAASNESPKVKAIANLKAFLKAPMDEELTAHNEGVATPGAEMVCRCVPVALCTCDTVVYYSGSDTCPTNCCVGDCKHWICTCVWV